METVSGGCVLSVPEDPPAQVKVMGVVPMLMFPPAVPVTLAAVAAAVPVPLALNRVVFQV